MMHQNRGNMVSVVVMAYNHETYIAECLNSILSQKTTFYFDIILGEDESSDSTRSICIDFAKRHPDKIKLFLRSRKDVIYINGGPTGRYNFLECLKDCTGKYIAICDGDDYWTDPLKLQKQVGFLEANNDYTLCFHNVNIVNTRKNANRVFPMHTKLDKSTFSTPDIIDQWFIPTASILFRQIEGFKFPHWFETCASGDIALLLLLSLEGKFYYINEIMACYRLHDTGLSKSHNGYHKVFSMIYLYQNFNIHTNYKFNKSIEGAMIYEVRKHLPEVQELNKIKKEMHKLRKQVNKPLQTAIKQKIKKILQWI